MTKYRVIYWRDIPVQVKVKNGSGRRSRPLSPRFQKAVYRAAYRGRAITGDDYMREWRPSGWQERKGDAELVLAAVSAELEDAYSDDRLNQLAFNKGYEGDDD